MVAQCNSVQLLSRVWLFATPWTAARQASRSITNSRSLLKLKSGVHPTSSSSVVPFSSCPQSFPASGSLQMSQLFASGGQSIWVSASTSVLPVNTQDWWPPLGWTGWISLQSDDKESACNAEDWIWSWSWDDPRQKGMAIHSSILAWRIPWTEESGGLQSRGRRELDTTEQLTLSSYLHI